MSLLFFSALRRSRKRVRAVVTIELPHLIRKEFPADQENDPTLLLGGASKASTVDIHKSRWMTLFKQLEHKLSEEESQLVNIVKISLPRIVPFFLICI